MTKDCDNFVFPEQRIGQFCVIGDVSAGYVPIRRTWFKTAKLAKAYAETLMNEQGGRLYIVQAVGLIHIESYQTRESRRRWTAMNCGEFGT